MKRGVQGEQVVVSTVGERVDAFLPFPLPPNPPIDWTPSLQEKFDRALLSLGKLDTLSTLLPDTSLFLYTYVRKEAVLSSMIEGTQSSLSDLLLFELNEEPGVPLNDVEEVSRYVAALDWGVKRLTEGIPLSVRLIKEVHGVLLKDGRGSKCTPGEFRRSQNWIGGSRPGNAMFVPPPAERVVEFMSQLELFLHDQPVSTPILVKAALAHVQFETIHPFLDGNGRVGRLLITLILCQSGVLQLPMLYLSLYFKTHRSYYYELLTRVRATGEWEAWLEFFADAVIETANGAVETAQRLLELSKEDQQKIKQLGRAAPSALQVHHALMERPIATSSWLAKACDLAPATVNRALERLQTLGVVRELTEQKRHRLFSYERYIEIIS